MRESIGGAFLFYLVIIFLGIYIALLAFGIVYAKAFNSKNHIITLLEENEGISNAQAKINTYMAARVGAGMQSAINQNQCVQYCVNNMNSAADDCNSRTTAVTGGCVISQSSKNNKGGLNAVQYTVVTYMDIDIPVIGVFVRSIPIAGETAVIYKR